MPLPVEALAEEVMRLSPADRSRLLDRVVASLDADRQRDEAWDCLAARREQEIDSGEADLVPVDDVIARLRAELA
jgi:hypothetical protein